MKHIIKVISFLGNTGILLRGTTKKTASQKGGLLKFPGPLLKTGFPLMKIVLTHLAKTVLITSWGQRQQQMQLFKKKKKRFWVGDNNINIFK